MPFHSPGDFSDPGIEPGSSALQADSLPTEPPEYRCITESLWYALETYMIMYIKYTSIKILQLKKKRESGGSALKTQGRKSTKELKGKNYKGKTVSGSLFIAEL